MRRDAGQSLVELAMLVPVLVLIVLGCIDLGRAFTVKMALANGVREGARYASMFPNAGPAELRRITEQDMLAQGLEGGNLTISKAAPQGLVGGYPVQVSASYTLPMLTSFLFGGKPIVVRAAAQMVIIGGN